MLDHGYQKEVLETIKNLHLNCGYENMNIYTYCLQDGYVYSNLKNLVRKFMKIYKMSTVRD